MSIFFFHGNLIEFAGMLRGLQASVEETLTRKDAELASVRLQKDKYMSAYNQLVMTLASIKPYLVQSHQLVQTIDQGLARAQSFLV
jgi:hypothetical protein